MQTAAKQLWASVLAAIFGSLCCVARHSQVFWAVVVGLAALIAFPRYARH
jgi:hypothetical protein